MTFRLLGPDQSTVLFDFVSTTGSGNPNTMVTKLMTDVAVSIGDVSHRLALRSTHGADLLGYDRVPGEISFSFSGDTATDDGLWQGMGTLGKYLLSAAVDHPIFLEWDETGTVFYYDIIGVLDLPQLLRGQPGGGLQSPRTRTLEPVPLRLLCQPWRRGASVTSSSDTVEDDPATGTPDGSRVYALTVTGDLPTPGKVRVQMDTGSAVERVLIGHRALKSRASTFFSDYIADTAWFQCEATNRNWTITLSNDTAAAADGALASPATGNVVAQVSGAGSTVGQMVRRVRATRTAAMDSLRGDWEPYLRVKATAAARWRIRAYWGPSTADPAPYGLDLKFHDTSANGTPSAFGYVELPLGVFHIPQTVALSGMAFEIHASRVSGTGNLNMDLVWFPPYPTSTVYIPAEGSEVTLDGAELATPVTNPASGTAGVVDGTNLNLDTTTDNAGWPPAGGSVLAAGRYVVTWKFELSGGPPSGGTVRAVIRNVTGSSDTYSATVSVTGSGVTTHRAFFDANGTSTYQPQADDPSTAFISIQSIKRAFTPAILVNESIRTDPSRYAVDRLDSSGNLSGYLGAEGQIPVLLQPGDNHLMLRADEIPLALYDENENKLDRDLTVTVTYDPRFAL